MTCPNLRAFPPSAGGIYDNPQHNFFIYNSDLGYWSIEFLQKGQPMQTKWFRINNQSEQKFKFKNH